MPFNFLVGDDVADARLKSVLWLASNRTQLLDQ